LKILILVFSAFLITAPAFAGMETCKLFEGTQWVGEKKGKGYQGVITIAFKGECKKSWAGIQIKYDWVGSNGKVVTPGALTFADSQEIKYKNTAGSKGKVTMKDNKLHWKNVFTGNNYNVHVTKK
tara:strand:- start:48 stop:422 length:375 start_codon:yes stop_codon:yes gene_type:complete